MGTVVGLRTNEGVIVAADTATSSGTVVQSDDVEKLWEIHPTAILGAASSSGSMRSFARAIRLETDRYETDRGERMDMNALSTLVASKLRSRPYANNEVLLGGVDDDAHVFTVSREDGVLEDTCVSIGSGMEVVYGILDDEAPASRSTPEARKVACRAIEAAIERDTDTGGSIQLAEISTAGIAIRCYESADDL